MAETGWKSKESGEREGRKEYKEQKEQQENNEEKEAVEQNLKDAGCGPELIEECLKCLEKGKLKEELRQLERHRGTLLERLHTEQKKIDCLDYLIYKTKKQL